MFKSARGAGRRTLSVLLAVLLFVSAAPLAGISVLAAGDEGLVFGEIVLTDTSQDGGGEPVTTTDTLYGVIEYRGDNKTVSIPSSKDGKVVEYIGDYAFSGTAVEFVTLPDTIRGIGKGAFMDCAQLNRVVIGNNKDVNCFGNFTEYIAFQKKLGGVLEANAFAGCSSLRHFAIFTSAASPAPPAVSFAAANVFAGCSKLTFYGWGNHNMVKTYYDAVFFPVPESECSYINLEEIINSVSGIMVNPSSAFMAKGETLALTVSVSPFNAGFLYNIYSFSTSDPEVATINDEGVIKAVGNGVARITVSSVNGYYADCDITVAERVEGNYGYRFLADGTVEIEKFASDVTGTVVVPAMIAGKKVTSIGDGAFSGCSGITLLTLPDSVIRIGVGAFMNCTGLALLNISASSSLKIIENSAFYGCSSLAFINIACALETIGNAAFRNCTSLSAVILPASFKELGKDAFLGDDALSIFAVKNNTNITLQTSIVYFSANAPLTIYADAGTSPHDYAIAKGISFVSGVDDVSEIIWTNLTSTLIVGESAALSVDAVVSGVTQADYDKAAFVSDNKNVVFVDGNTVNAVGAGTAKIYAIVANGKVVSAVVTVKKGVSGDYEYKLIGNMTEAEITGYTNNLAEETVVPDTVMFKGAPLPVTAVSSGAFSDAASLKRIVIGALVSSLNGSAFDMAYALEEITVSGDNVYYCTSDGILFNAAKTAVLKYPAAKQGGTYKIPSGITSIGDYAFKDNNNLTSVIFMQTLTKIGSHSFENMNRLLGVNLPATVSSIGNFAFAYNSVLDYILIPKAVSYIGESAFFGTDVTIYGYEGYYAKTYADLYAIPFANAALLVEVGELRLSASVVTLKTTDTYMLNVSVYPASASYPVYYFQSADPQIATVDADGLIKALAEGDTVITVRSARGVFAECVVSVVDSSSGDPGGGEKAVSVAVVLQPDKMIYENGENLDFTGGLVEATLQDGASTKVITIIDDHGNIASGVRIRGYNAYEAGAQTIEIIYGKVYTTLTVSVLERKLTGISVTRVPDDTTCIVGLDINPAGLIVTGHYNNGQSDEITDYTLSAAPAKVGPAQIKVSCGAFADFFDINVLDKSVVSVSITPPSQLTYYQGNALDLSGFAATAYYNNGTSSPLYADQFTFTGYDANTLGAQRVKAVYTDLDGNAFENSFYATVLENVVTTLEIALLPVKQTYENGEPLDFKGAAVYAKYSDGSTKRIINADGSFAAGVEIRNYEPLKAGNQTVQIVFAEKIVTISVTVLERKLTGISVTKLPDKMTYIEGSQVDTDGLVITASYNNGQTEEVTGYTVSVVPSSPGTHPVTVTYGGFTADFSITVIKKTLKSIEITPPAKTAYVEGDTLDLTGFAAVAYYDNGTNEALGIDAFSFAGYNPHIIGNQRIDAVYTGGDAVITKSFFVTVVARTLKEIQIVTQPDKQVYILGETLDITGMVVIASYDNSTYEQLYPMYLFEFDNVILSLGDNYITIQYEENKVTCSATFKVFVELGNYNGEFTYKINDGGIEIVKILSSVSGNYTIPEKIGKYPVKMIANSAFRNNSAITSVVIPNSVTSMGIGAFENCGSLTSVTIGSGITKIPDNAFYKCKNLKSVILPSSVIEIGQLAFARCDALAFVSVPSSVKKISADAFDYNGKDFKIVAPSGSAAHSFAVNSGIKWEAPNLIIGDVNGDGIVGIEDARLALRGAVGLETLDAQAKIRADYNKNGALEVADARLILRKAVGLI